VNPLINKVALGKVKEAFPDLTEEAHVDIITLSQQGKLGVRMIAHALNKKLHLNLSKDHVHRVIKKYREECAKTHLKPSQVELKVNSLAQEVDNLKGTADLKTRKDDLVRQKLWYSLKAQGNLFVGNLIKRKVLKDLTEAQYFTEILHYTQVLWILCGRDNVLDYYGVSAPQLLATFSEWYTPGTEIYGKTGHFATGEECLAIEIYYRMWKVWNNRLKEIARARTARIPESKREAQ
jgi:hypothetical protein